MARAFEEKELTTAKVKIAKVNVMATNFMLTSHAELLHDTRSARNDKQSNQASHLGLAPKRSPDVTVRAVGGNRLRFRRLDFVLKFTVLLLRSIAYASELDPVDCAER